MVKCIEYLSCCLQPWHAGMSGEVSCIAEWTPLFSVCQWEQSSRAAPSSINKAGKKTKKHRNIQKLSLSSIVPYQRVASCALQTAATLQNDVRSFTLFLAKDTF